MKNQFSDLYRKLPTIKLLEIIDNPFDYQELAIEAAKSELAIRDDIQIATEQWNQKKEILQDKAIEVEQQFQKKKDKVKELFGQKDSLDSNKTAKPIRIICTILLAIFFFRVFRYFDMIIESLSIIDKWDFSMYLFMLELIYMPFAIYYAWKMSKLGWIMLIVYFSYYILSGVRNIYLYYQIFGIEQNLSSFFQALIFSLILPFMIFYAAMLCYLLRSDIKALFEKTIEEEDDIIENLVD